MAPSLTEMLPAGAPAPGETMARVALTTTGVFTTDGCGTSDPIAAVVAALLTVIAAVAGVGLAPPSVEVTELMESIHGAAWACAPVTITGMAQRGLSYHRPPPHLRTCDLIVSPNGRRLSAPQRG